jgi:hypothetical protein
MELKMYKKTLLLLVLYISFNAFGMKEESSSEEGVIFPPEVFENIRRQTTPTKAKHQLESTGRLLYYLGQEDRKGAIIQKAQEEALISLLQNNIKRKSKIKFTSIHPDFVTLYKQAYVHYLFYYGSWDQFFEKFEEKKMRSIAILPNWKLKYQEFPGYQSISIVVKQGKLKTPFLTMIHCPPVFSSAQFEDLIQQSHAKPSIRKIVLNNKTLFNTQEKTKTIITHLKKYRFKGIITVDTENLTVIAASCKGKILLSLEQFKFFLDSNDLYAVIPYATQSPLTLFCQEATLSSPTFVELLLDYGADPNMQDYDEYTPLHSLCFGTITDIERHKNIMKILLKYGANPNIQNKMKWTPLMLLCTKTIPPLELIELLLQYGADPNGQEKLSWSALRYAFRSKNNFSIDLVKLLLRYGGDPYLKHNFDTTPFDLIQDEDIKREVIEYYELLKKEGA